MEHDATLYCFASAILHLILILKGLHYQQTDTGVLVPCNSRCTLNFRLIEKQDGIFLAIHTHHSINTELQELPTVSPDFPRRRFLRKVRYKRVR